MQLAWVLRIPFLASRTPVVQFGLWTLATTFEQLYAVFWHIPMVSKVFHLPPEHTTQLFIRCFCHCRIIWIFHLHRSDLENAFYIT